MFCSIVNLANTIVTKYVLVFQFLYIVGGAEMLSLPGCYMLIRLKEAADVEDGRSFKVSPDISVPEFRTYSGFESLYRSRLSNYREGDQAHALSMMQAA